MGAQRPARLGHLERARHIAHLRIEARKRALRREGCVGRFAVPRFSRPLQIAAPACAYRGLRSTAARAHRWNRLPRRASTPARPPALQSPRVARCLREAKTPRPPSPQIPEQSDQRLHRGARRARTRGRPAEAPRAARQRPIILPQRRTSALQTDIERLRDSKKTIVRKCSRAISRIQQSKHGGGIAGVAIGTERAFSDEG